MRYSKENLEKIAKISLSIKEVIRRLGGNEDSGGVFQHVKTKLIRHNIDTSHFLGRSVSRKSVPCNKLTSKDILVENRTGCREDIRRLKRCLDEIGISKTCVVCGLSDKWMGKDIVLEVDHINKNRLDNRPENLRYLCPNCHSQT